jgi:probable HAF family extracellular repeat protein
MRDLGVFPDGALLTVAGCCHTINDSGQVVGVSIDATFNMRALVWQNGVPTDLNVLIPADTPWYLLAAASINYAGEIVWMGSEHDRLRSSRILASPIVGIGPAARGAVRPPALPSKVRNRLRRQLHF